MKIAYLFSRYPVVSQTFCETEMLALEAMGIDLTIGSIHEATTSFRHGHSKLLKAPVYYAPPIPVRKRWEQLAKQDGDWPEVLIATHDERFGADMKSGLRARNALYFAKLFREKGVQHIHVHFANRATHTAMFISQLSGIPFSFTAHAQDFMVDLPEEMVRGFVEAAKFVVGVSDFSCGLLKKMCPGHEEKIHRVYNGIDVEKFRSGVHVNSVPKIVSIGRLIEFKGFRHLVQACEGLRERGLEFECEIIGDGPLRQELEEMIEKAGLQDYVKLRGILSQENVALHLREADLFVLASDIDDKGASDILPTVILEAMACGRPVISTDVAGIPEMVRDGETGRVVKRGDIKGFVHAMFELLADHEQRRDFGAAGRRRLEELFAVKKTSRALKELFEKYADTSVTASEKIEERKKGTDVLLLNSAWPDKEFPLMETEKNALEQAGISVRALVCNVTDGKWLKDVDVRPIEYLPDMMILEADWRAYSKEAHKLEQMRWEFGDGISTEVFLESAKAALWLQLREGDFKDRHLHVYGQKALLTGVLWKRLSGGGRISVTLERKPEWSDEVLKILLGEVVGGRAASRLLVERFDRVLKVDYDAWRSAKSVSGGGVFRIFQRKKEDEDSSWGGMLPSEKWVEDIVAWSRLG